MIKAILRCTLPKRLVAEISSHRWWSHLIDQNRRNGHADFSRRIVDRCGNVVIAGPFKGLVYPDRVLISHSSTPHLLGTYEAEIHPWLERTLGNGYERIVDIGAGEGYYAVGMAMRTKTQIDAYEPCSLVRRDCRELARINHVKDLVRVHSWCDQTTLQKLEGQRCLILSDCEGYEIELFSPRTIQALGKSDLIVELHNGKLPAGTTRHVLVERIGETHRIEFVSVRQRNPSDFPHLAFLDPDDARKAISEDARTDGQEWMLAVAKLSNRLEVLK